MNIFKNLLSPPDVNVSGTSIIPHTINRYLRWGMLVISLSIIGLLGFLFYRQWDVLVNFPWHINIKSIIFVSIFHQLALNATFWAWHLIISRLGKCKNLVVNLRFYYVSTLAKRLPTNIPYIGGRLALYKQMGVSAKAVLNGILLESILIGLGGVLVFLLFSPFYSTIPNGIIIPLSIVGLILFIALILRPQLIIELSNSILKRLNRQPLESMPNRKDMLIWIGLYMLPWVLSGISFYFAPRAILEMSTMNIFDALAVSSLATLVSLINLFIPGGLALKELTASALLSVWLPLPVALVLTIFYRIIHTLDELIATLLVLLVPFHE